MSLDKLVAKKLTKEEINAEARKLVRDFSGLPGLTRMILFGSAARGTMCEASDVDVVLLFEEPEQSQAAARKVYSSKMRQHSKWPADILCVDEKQYLQKSKMGGVFFVAREEGKIIFEKEKK